MIVICRQLDQVWTCNCLNCPWLACKTDHLILLSFVKTCTRDCKFRAIQGSTKPCVRCQEYSSRMAFMHPLPVAMCFTFTCWELRSFLTLTRWCTSRRGSDPMEDHGACNLQHSAFETLEYLQGALIFDQTTSTSVTV